MMKDFFTKRHSEHTGCHTYSIFLLAFSVRLFLVWYLLGLGWRYNTGDGYENAIFLEHILKNSCYMPPGQYLFAGFINQFFSQPHYLLLRIATILLSALVSVNIYKIGRENFNQGVGIIAGYFSIFSLTLLFHSLTFFGTTLVTCLFSLFVLYFFRLLKYPIMKNIIVAGFSLGLSVLTKAEMLIFMPFAFFWFLLVKGIKGDSLKNIFNMLFIAFLVISCWTVRNYLICNKFVLVSSNGPVNYFIGNNPFQKGRYSPPIISNNGKGNYFLSGLVYNLEHPGWAVQFFKEKFKLYWSTRTREHPKQLLESRFDKSAVKLFNDSYEASRLNKFIENAKMSRFYELIVLLYGYWIGVFWLFIFLGLLCGHLFWHKYYFLIGICFVNALVYSIFFSGANRYFVPMLPYLYILMGIGITFTYKITYLSKIEIKTLTYRNILLLLVIVVNYIFSVLLIYQPEEKLEKIGGLYNWNVLSMEHNSLSLIILESQLSYPVKEGSLTKESFAVWVDEIEIHYRKLHVKKSNEACFYFRRVKNLLCKNAFIIYLPDTYTNTFLTEKKSSNKKVTISEIVKLLDGKISVRYIPAWQLHNVINNVIQRVLKLLREQQVEKIFFPTIKTDNLRK